MKKGTICIITDGEYDDYRVLDAYYIKKDFSFDKESEKFQVPQVPMPATNTPQYARAVNYIKYLPYLEDNNFIEKIHLKQIYLENDNPEESESNAVDFLDTSINQELPEKQWIPTCLEHQDCEEHTMKSLGVVCAQNGNKQI